MKVTERTISEIAWLSLNPIMGRLSERAREEVVKNFCKPRCRQEPRGNFCPNACTTYRQFLKLQLEDYASLN